MEGEEEVYKTPAIKRMLEAGDSEVKREKKISQDGSGFGWKILGVINERI